MAELIFNFPGYLFQEGLHVLQSVYSTAADAVREEWEKAKEDALAYQLGVERGEIAWEGERDESGFIIWDKEQVHEMEVQSKREALTALKNAFVIAAYHHWERSARRWTESNRASHERLAYSVQALGIPLDGRLGAVRDLANLLKHNHERWGRRLLTSWPDVVSVGRTAVGRVDWYGAVNITEAQMEKVFEIISLSGPTDKTNWAKRHGRSDDNG